MNTFKAIIFGASVLFLTLVVMLTLEFGFGYINIFRTNTIVKQQKLATRKVEREVYEQSESYVEGKRQDALKYYQEYIKSDSSSKETIKGFVATAFANFDEELLNPELRDFVHNCKYK